MSGAPPDRPPRATDQDWSTFRPPPGRFETGPVGPPAGVLLPAVRPTVAAAVILQHGHVLLVRRKRAEGDLSWQFPAGVIEPGETPEEAAVRETDEETGVRTAAILLLGERVHPGTGRSLAYVACQYRAGTAHVAAPQEITQTAWAPVPDLAGLIPGGVFGPVRAYLTPSAQSLGPAVITHDTTAGHHQITARTAEVTGTDHRKREFHA